MEKNNTIFSAKYGEATDAISKMFFMTSKAPTSKNQKSGPIFKNSSAPAKQALSTEDDISEQEMQQSSKTASGSKKADSGAEV